MPESPATLLKKRRWHRCFPVNFVEFLRTSFLRNTSGRLLLWLTFRIQNIGALPNQHSITKCLFPGYLLSFSEILKKKNGLCGFLLPFASYIWDNIFKNEPSKICGRQPLKNLKWYGLFKQMFLQCLISNLFVVLKYETMMHLFVLVCFFFKFVRMELRNYPKL